MEGIEEHNEEMCKDPLGCVCMCDECNPSCIRKLQEESEHESTVQEKEVKWKRDTMIKRRKIRTK